MNRIQQGALLLFRNKSDTCNTRLYPYKRCAGLVHVNYMSRAYIPNDPPLSSQGQRTLSHWWERGYRIRQNAETGIALRRPYEATVEKC